MIAICASMRWELRPVLRAIAGIQSVRGFAPKAWVAAGRAPPLLVFQTGVGMETAARATKAILRSFSPTVLINTGCAGGLDPQLRVGGIVCSSELLCERADGQIAVLPTNEAWTRRLFDASTISGLETIRGPVLTSPRALSDSAAKRQAVVRFSAVAVEMEGTAVAEVAAAAGVEIASVRAILDDAHTDLPRLPAVGNTMFDFVRETAQTILSVEHVKRFSIAGKNALIVDRVLGGLFNRFLNNDV